MSSQAQTTGSSDTRAAANAKSPVLRTDELARFFVDGERRLDVLKGVNLAIYANEVTALVGRSGSGKSTLLHLLGLLDTPNSGEVLIDNTPAGSLSESDRAFLRNKHIGFIFQHYFLLPEFNVLENVLMPAKVAVSPGVWLSKKKDFETRALELIERVGLKNNLNQLPRTLSGGERQRVSVARALMLQPRILLCDEPTGNLDPGTGNHIMELIFELSRKQNAAVLVVTHDPAFSSRADRVLRLDAGTLTTE